MSSVRSVSAVQPSFGATNCSTAPFEAWGLPVLLDRPDGTLAHLRGKPNWTSHRPHPPKQ